MRLSRGLSTYRPLRCLRQKFQVFSLYTMDLWMTKLLRAQKLSKYVKVVLKATSLAHIISSSGTIEKIMFRLVFQSKITILIFVMNFVMNFITKFITRFPSSRNHLFSAPKNPKLKSTRHKYFRRYKSDFVSTFTDFGSF